MTGAPTITLNDGKTIPQLGFGTWQVEADIAQQSVEKALEVGYRHIDTAAIYGNEEGVGRGIAASGIPREEIFLTTKLWNDDHGAEPARKAINSSLERLGVDYVDLYLIHWPCPKNKLYVETWEALQQFHSEGLARSIGVSNFTQETLEEVIATGMTPVVNQIELHPYFSQAHMRDVNKQHTVATEAWSPLGQGGDVLENPVIKEVAQEVEATTAQVILAWHLALGNIIFPKSVTPERIEENWAARTVELNSAQISRISGLTRLDGRIGIDPVEFN